jgi:hypothetical protein
MWESRQSRPPQGLAEKTQTDDDRDRGSSHLLAPSHTTVQAGPHTAVQQVEPLQAGGSSRRSPRGLRRSAGFRFGFTVF